MTSPPCPPLPPSGPPSGLNFSRWTDATPCPPLPPVTCSVTWSTKLGMAIGRSFQDKSKTARNRGPPCMGLRSASVFRRDDVDDLAAALDAELDGTRSEREQRVVTATADI